MVAAIVLLVGQGIESAEARWVMFLSRETTCGLAAGVLREAFICMLNVAMVGCMLSLPQLIDLCASSRLAWALGNLRCEIPIGPSSSDDVRAVGPKKR